MDHIIGVAPGLVVCCVMCVCNSLQGNKDQYILYCAVGISLCSKGFPEKAKLAENWIEGALDVLVMEK